MLESRARLRPERPAGRGVGVAALGAKAPMWALAVRRGDSRTTHHGGRMYEKPKLECLGTLRELTLAGGANVPGDGVNPYHRYGP